jgi:hypothetical protein
MAYDDGLAARIRDLLRDEDAVTEARMFGGLAFLVGGHLAVAASGQGGLMARVPPEDTDALLAEPGVGPMVMRGRALDGWLRVGDEGLDTEQRLRSWVHRGVAYARSLPLKG